MTTYEQHVDHLSNVLRVDSPNLEESQQYLDGCFRIQTIGLGAPPEMRYLQVNPGWPSTYLNAIENRLDIEGFRADGQPDAVEELWKWWQDNNLDEESSLGHMDALTFGRAYVTVAAPGEEDDQESPIIRLESPLSMYAELDPRTRKVTRAVRLYQTDSSLPGLPDRATLLLPDETVFLRRSDGPASQWVRDGAPVKHQLGIVPVVPLTNKAKLSNRYGRSEIGAELRQLTDAGGRTLMNLQAASELIAVPLRVFFGIEKEELVGSGTNAEVNGAYYGRLVTIENELAKAFEFKAAELRNFTEEMSELSRQVASVCGLPPQYLSFSSENPASAEAIIASESRLVKTCERKARMFGGSWEQVMRLATKVMGKPVPDEYRRLETVWSNPATPTYAAKADAATKLYAAGQGVIPKEQARIDIGYTAAQRENMKDWDKEEIPALTALQKIVNPAPVAAPPGAGSTNGAKPAAKPAPAAK